ncbi:TPA: hypothetical protein U2R15_004063 [Klebsiella aerogenes]|nr:hypothetical protein [Klebsiella aerogenes]
MSPAVLMVFALIMFTGVVTPRPATVLLALNETARFGIPRAFRGTQGTVAADVLLVVLVASETLFIILKWSVAVWFAFTGVRIQLSSEPSLPGTPEAMSNPKYSIFMTVVLPQFVSMAQPVLP